MSTRAVVTIKDERDEFHVYTHSDGYPEYQVKRLVDAVPPRFEAMDFAAAFVRGSKESGGTGTATWEYRYEVTAQSKQYFAEPGKANPLTVRVFTMPENKP